MNKKIELPSEDDLPPGPVRDLTIRIHSVYDEANWPSMQKIVDAMEQVDAPGTSSRQYVYNILKGLPRRPSWPIIESIVRALASKTRRQVDIDTLVAEVEKLWRLAYAPETENSEPFLENDYPAAEITDDADSVIADQSVRETLTDLHQLAATSTMEELIHAFEILTIDENASLEDLKVFTTAVANVHSPYRLIPLIEKMRRRSLHDQAESIIREAVANLSIRDLTELVELFYKENWRLDILISAISAFRSAEEVAMIIFAMGDRKEAVELQQRFAQIRSAHEVAQLAEAMD
ncbi:hypothetical protein [Streptomyces sp. NBC_01455]|uniref:hypothetical protein n=1 Tax=Streptomyces sp. NBC_01455 TaxID=2903874 RepID=UPI002E348319|nr:hypothetical protein [Streptomyces sp. NBC_01455]